MSYQNAVREAWDKQQALKPDRFVKISERLDNCGIPKELWRQLTENAYLQTWKGLTIEKDPMQIALYPMLLYELQPKTIIELGTLNGGSAVWLADQLDLFQIEGHVYSVDIDLSLLDEKTRNDSRIDFLQGDCNDISGILPAEMLANLPHPWIVIEDVHVNLIGIMEYFHNFLQSGDYLIVEDTNNFMWEVWQDWDDQELIERGLRKHEELKGWVINHEDEYLVDTYYLDMYGYNSSKNWNSILKKV